MRSLLLSVLLLAGCVSGKDADRATFDAIAPEYLGYVDADPNLDQEQKLRRHDTVASWDAKTKDKP